MVHRPDNLWRPEMKKLVIAAVLASCASLNLHAADPVTVNGVAINQSLVDYIIKEAAAQGKKVDDSARAGIIEKLITSAVIDQEAQKSGITRQPDFLAMQELSLQELRVNAYIEDYVRKHPIDDRTLHAEYDRLNALASAKEYKAGHIMLKTEDEAREVIARLGKNEDFAQIAKEQSLDGSRDNGGDLGWLVPEDMVQPFADALVKLQKGSYSSAPVQTEFGWHVIRLEDTRDAQPLPFEAVKERLYSNLQRQQLEKMVSGLRAGAKIVNGTAPK